MSYIYASSNMEGDPPPPGDEGDQKMPGIKPPTVNQPGSAGSGEENDADIKPPTYNEPSEGGQP
jgi:hypothetical protein